MADLRRAGRVDRKLMDQLAEILCDEELGDRIAAEEEKVRRAKGGQIDADTANEITNLEPDSSDGLPAKAKSKEVYPRFCIRIHSQRRRLTDPDGLYSKAAIDGLTVGGLLSDDSAKVIESVSYTQSLVEKGESEETIIIIEEVPEVG